MKEKREGERRGYNGKELRYIGEERGARRGGRRRGRGSEKIC